jgi:hypothetical protein
MSDDFHKIKSIDLWEADDHYVIQLSLEGSPYSQHWPFPITSPYVIRLCRLFDIPYDKQWEMCFIGDKEWESQIGTQITIHKQPQVTENAQM